MSMLFLPLAFFITALFYASVGFGGGSTYNALLALAGTDYRVMPILALLCNITVVSGGTWRFFKAGHLDFARAAPWIIASIPAAWIGGRIDIPEKFFIGLLGASLLISGMQVLLHAENPQMRPDDSERVRHSVIMPFALGGGLGMLSGLVGIGGGIFLAPILYALRWGNARAIAGTCSLFILVNSLSGLSGQLIKSGNISLAGIFGGYWTLIIAVLAGGQIGSYMGSIRLNPKILRTTTGILILYVALRLLLRWWRMD